jgi:riboflavin kinase/FMN adenylyltransferase
MSLEERCEKIRELGIEQLFVLQFTREVAELGPEEFVVAYVQAAMRAQVVMVGENFRFGHKQAGDPSALMLLGQQHGFATRLIAPVTCRGVVVSTSTIRARLQAGEVSFSGRLLGRPYGIAGEVVHGFGIGSKQTVPTLNLRSPVEVLPRNGVYITETADLQGSRRWNSITNIGYRPTFGGDELTIETYLLSRLEGATPESIRVKFLRRVREERKFENAEALRSQILRDVDRTRSYFRRIEEWVGQKATT